MNRIRSTAIRSQRTSPASRRNHAAPKRTGAASKRTGAAFLLLVVALLLVVLGATQAMLRGEIASQRSRQQQLQTDTLERAIISTRNVNLDWKSTVELPIDDRQRIVISVDRKKTQLTAHWMSGHDIHNTVVRDFVQTELSRPDETDRPSDPEI